MQFIRTARRSLAIFVVASMLGLASGASANDERPLSEPGAESSSPIALDLLFLRPVGLMGLFAGTALYIAPVLPLTLVSRPSEVGKPVGAMIVRPARYVFSDPIGEH